jgi:transcriptional regulator with XRE-family HTH domain
MSSEILEQFREFCRENKLTQKNAADRLGCDHSHVSKMFSGVRNPSKKMLAKIEAFMNEYEKEE